MFEYVISKDVLLIANRLIVCPEYKAVAYDNLY